MPKKALLFPIMLMLVTSLTFAFFAFAQPVISYSLEPRMDAHQYHKIYRYFKGENKVYHISFPFHSRIAIPFLAAALPISEELRAFQLINFVFTLLGVLALYSLWQKLEIPVYLMGLGFFWLLFHWISMIRSYQSDPISVDVPLFFIQTIFLLILFSRHWKHLLWLAPLGTLQKESFSALLLVLLAYGLFYNYYRKQPYFAIPIIFTALVISLITKAVVNVYFPPLESGRGSVITILYFIRETLYDPFRLVRWIVSIFMAFGGLLYLAGWQVYKDFRIDPFINLLLLCSLTYFGLGLLAGGDFTRIVFLGFPFIMTLILWSVKKCVKKEVWIAFILSLPFMRLESSIPDISKEYFSWFPEFTSVQMVLLWLLYAILVGAVVWWIKYATSIKSTL